MLEDLVMRILNFGADLAFTIWISRAFSSLLRRRRCFEIAKPRRSAGGAQLNRSLGEFEGPIRDLNLRLFAKDYQVSSAKVGPASLQIELKSVRVMLLGPV
jgi:hypothetical protein